MKSIVTRSTFYQPAARFMRGRLVLRLLCIFASIYASALITCTIITYVT